MRVLAIACLVSISLPVWAQEAPETETQPLSVETGARAKAEATIPWASQLRFGMGGDSNIDMSRYGSDPTLLSGFDLVSQVQPTRRLRIATQVEYEKNLPATTPGAGGAELFVGYLRALPSALQLRLSAQVGFRRERSVFADSIILQNSTALQSILENNVAALLVYNLGSLDIEAGTQTNVEAHSSNVESSNLFGVNAIAGLRYTYRDRVALRARYSYEFSDTRGLSARNLAGGVDPVDRPLLLAVNRLRFSARTRLGKRSSVFARYDYVDASDDYSGHLDSHEHVAFLACSLDYDALTLDANTEIAHRDFFRRTASLDNNGTDTTLSGGLRADAWILPEVASASRLGLFAQYRVEVVSAEPIGLIFARHIVVGGVAAQFGKGP